MKHVETRLIMPASHVGIVLSLDDHGDAGPEGRWYEIRVDGELKWRLALRFPEYAYTAMDEIAARLSNGSLTPGGSWEDSRHSIMLASGRRLAAQLRRRGATLRPLFEMDPTLDARFNPELRYERPEWFDAVAAHFDLVGWTPMPIEYMPFRYGRTADPPTGMLLVCVSGFEVDGARWVHASYSRPARMPSYEDGCLVKERFIGPEARAIAIFAPASKHMNHHPYCLHLWACLDDDRLPDFQRYV